jgi:hypothetical protein
VGFELFCVLATEQASTIAALIFCSANLEKYFALTIADSDLSISEQFKEHPWKPSR